MLNTRPPILLNPGPVTLSERVRSALLREDQCHREQSYADLMLKIIRQLRAVYAESQADFTPVTVSGSGTCAVEMMVSSLAPRVSKTLVLANGVYGERIANMLDQQNKPYQLLRSDWLQDVDLLAAEQVLQADPEFTHVISVHHETTTGRLNNLSALLDLCQRQQKYLLLDAVSSFGAEAIDFSADCLLAVAATANKCLHGVPGMAFVLVRSSVMEQSQTTANSLYLDLFRYYHAQKSGFSPFTPAVHASFALDEALQEHAEAGGWLARRTLYAERARVIRDAMASLGVQQLLATNAYSSSITTFLLPQHMTYADIHQRMLTAGFVIYAGQGDLAKTAFRICNMGDIHSSDLERLCAALTEIFS